jgi:hypothetical protein
MIVKTCINKKYYFALSIPFTTHYQHFALSKMMKTTGSSRKITMKTLAIFVVLAKLHHEEQRAYNIDLQMNLGE